MKIDELGKMDNHPDCYAKLDSDKEGSIYCRVCGKIVGWQTRHCRSITVEECSEDSVSDQGR